MLFFRLCQRGLVRRSVSKVQAGLYGCCGCVRKDAIDDVRRLRVRMQFMVLAIHDVDDFET